VDWSLNIVDLLLVFFATYRLSTMFYHDDELGPGQLLYRIKIKLGVLEADDGTLYGMPGTFQDALLCYFCNSPYIGLLTGFVAVVLALVDMRPLAQMILLPFAASGFVLLVAKYTESD